KKENLLVISPDSHPDKEQIIQQLRNIPGLIVQIIQNLTYEQYKETISRAKWAITFGEGLDGYIIEPIFSGAVGFAVFNEDFFTEDFRGIPCIYDNYAQLAERILEDIQHYDQKERYYSVNKTQYELCAKYYDYAQYQENIRKFYLKEYTFK
ncbi:MAG: hypothetical protein ACKO96_42925, partial [Flammeovirgaceae bacterium]